MQEADSGIPGTGPRTLFLHSSTFQLFNFKLFNFLRHIRHPFFERRGQPVVFVKSDHAYHIGAAGHPAFAQRHAVPRDLLRSRAPRWSTVLCHTTLPRRS